MTDPFTEPLTFEDANALQRALRRLAASGPGAWLFARVLYRIDRPVYRITRGRHTFASFLSGIPVVMITTTGARSGRPRTVPVLGLPTPDGLAVIASNKIWTEGLRVYPGWSQYERRASHRRIAVFVLEPV